MSKGEKTANNGKKDKNNSTFSFGRGLFIYLGVIYLALFRWLTSPLGQLGSHHDGASGKRAVSTGTLLLIAAVWDKAARARRNEGDWDGDVGAAGVLSLAHPLPTGP